MRRTDPREERLMTGGEIIPLSLLGRRASPNRLPGLTTQERQPDL